MISIHSYIKPSVWEFDTSDIIEDVRRSLCENFRCIWTTQTFQWFLFQISASIYSKQTGQSGSIFIQSFLLQKQLCKTASRIKNKLKMHGPYPFNKLNDVCAPFYNYYIHSYISHHGFNFSLFPFFSFNIITYIHFYLNNKITNAYTHIN